MKKAQQALDEGSVKKSMEIGLLGASARMLEQFNKYAVGRIRELVDSPARLMALGASCNGRIAELERSVTLDKTEL